MDTNKSGSIQAHQMAAACKSVGYSKCHNKLFKLLLDGPGKRHISMADLDPAAMQAYWRGDLEALSPLEKARASLAARKKADKEAKEKNMEAYDWLTLKKVLIRKFGTISSAWRECLDIAGNGKVSFAEFGKQVRGIGFSGDIRQIFSELDKDDSGLITFNEIDSQWYSRISEFNELMLSKYGCYEDAWNALDRNQNSMVEASEFERLCSELGYQSDAKALFRQFLKNPLRKYLDLDDVEGKAAIIRANKADPQSSNKFYMHADSMLTDAEKAKRELDRRKAMMQAEKSMNNGADSWESLKELLIRRYGSITAAWRQALDWGGNGKLSHTEWCTACRIDVEQVWLL
jgi:Ca2+-binding EF-hand superfamily protein